jgi:glycerol kinase
MQILRSVEEAMDRALDDLVDFNISFEDIQALAVTNQRITTVIWDKETGQPLYNAIAWMDTRIEQSHNYNMLKSLVTSQYETTGGAQRADGGHDGDYFQSYPKWPWALRVRWLLDNSVEVRTAVDANRALVGTIDSWLIWNLTGGPEGGKHVTDVTNASSTMLHNIDTLQWDERLIDFFDIPAQLLPAVRSSSEIYGVAAKGKLHGVPICGILCDHQAALVGQGCFQRGQANYTYANRCFLLCNIGSHPIISKHGLGTIVAYQMGPNSTPVYALKGLIALPLSWLESSGKRAETLAFSVQSAAGVYYIPAYSTVFHPYWKSSPCSTIGGLTQFTNKSSHLPRRFRSHLFSDQRDCRCHPFRQRHHP